MFNLHLLGPSPRQRIAKSKVYRSRSQFKEVLDNLHYKVGVEFDERVGGEDGLLKLIVQLFPRFAQALQSVVMRLSQRTALEGFKVPNFLKKKSYSKNSGSTSHVYNV